MEMIENEEPLKEPLKNVEILGVYRCFIFEQIGLLLWAICDIPIPPTKMPLTAFLEK